MLEIHSIRPHDAVIGIIMGVVDGLSIKLRGHGVPGFKILTCMYM